MQGVSTTIYAATAPELRGRGGSYLADCAVAEPSQACQDMSQVSSANTPDKAWGYPAGGMAWERNDRAGPGGLAAPRVYEHSNGVVHAHCRESPVSGTDVAALA